MTAPLSDDQLRHLRDLVDFPDLSGTRYEIQRRIATGGMGTVFLASDRELLRDVALKVLTLPDPSGAWVERILREAQTLAQLEHPAIIPIHDVGRLPDGRVYYTMKHVEGSTLQEFRRPSVPLGELLRLLPRVCDAVAFAHSRGVIHRDLKPANIMVGPFGEVLVMDWGIALRVSGDNDDSGSQSELDDSKVGSADATGADSAIGTPGYMSPEQAAGVNGSVDHRTDIYGLGAVLYFILTGSPPVSASTSAEALDRVRKGQFKLPRERNPDIPKRLEAICLKAMATNPFARYQSAGALSKDLQLYLEGLPVTAYRESIWEKSRRWIGNNQFIVIIALVYVIVRFFFLLWRGI
jgi:eukaryotic-like serine/threonine-protein kinase